MYNVVLERVSNYNAIIFSCQLTFTNERQKIGIIYSLYTQYNQIITMVSVMKDYVGIFLEYLR
jgi:hypothetical protein